MYHPIWGLQPRTSLHRNLAWFRSVQSWLTIVDGVRFCGLIFHRCYLKWRYLPRLVSVWLNLWRILASYLAGKLLLILIMQHYWSLLMIKTFKLSESYYLVGVLYSINCTKTQFCCLFYCCCFCLLLNLLYSLTFYNIISELILIGNGVLGFWGDRKSVV